MGYSRAGRDEGRILEQIRIPTFSSSFLRPSPTRPLVLSAWNYSLVVGKGVKIARAPPGRGGKQPNVGRSL